MEFAKAVATQLPQVTVDHELVFQFYRVCSEVHNCTLSATPKLLQHAGAAAPCYQVGVERSACRPSLLLRAPRLVWSSSER